MRIGWRHVFASLAALFAGGLLVVWLGIIDVRASSGHWKVTDWFLHWAMRSSVRTAALGIEAPPLDNPAHLPLAAGHYEVACAICHGSPAEKQSPAMLRMLPPPPDLKQVVTEWTDEQLFEIVKHGIRYTGMPAWPAGGRDDEVWAMVAFLRASPDLDGERYRQLTGRMKPPGDDPSTAVAYCEACHAVDRLDGTSLIPRLDGQSSAYLRESLQAFRKGTRPSGVMQTAVNNLDDQMMAELARHFASRQAGRNDMTSPPSLVTLGDPTRKIPACSNCHDKPGINPAYPRLAEQSIAYIRNQLKLFVAGKRGGTPYADLMTRAARNLSEQEIEALASYYGR